jgi:hypothetical protein
MPRISRQSAHEAGNVVSPTIGRLYPQKISLLLIYVIAESTSVP